MQMQDAPLCRSHAVSPNLIDIIYYWIFRVISVLLGFDLGF